MSLCLIDVHGDIEGDFEWVEDLPKNRKEFLIAIEELEKIREELHETAEMHSNGNYYLRDEWIDEYIDKHISELKGGAE